MTDIPYPQTLELEPHEYWIQMRAEMNQIDNRMWAASLNLEWLTKQSSAQVKELAKQYGVLALCQLMLDKCK